jgi:hypothetical protein
MRRIGLLAVSFCCVLSVLAQGIKKPGKKEQPHFYFQSLNQLGLLEGSQGSAFQLQSINGIKYKTWFAGAGVGIDYYKFRTIPLFFDLRKDLQNKDRTVFVFGDIGTNFPWIKTETQTYWMGNDDYNSGLYYEMGLGYKLVFHKKDALLLSAGYSFKKMTEKRFGNIACPAIGPCEQGLIEKLDYGLKRISVKLGWSF